MSPDHIAELALIETSRLQRYALSFARGAPNDKAAQEIARDCLAEMARRDRALTETNQERAAA